MTSIDEQPAESMRGGVPAAAFRPEQLPAESNGNPQFIAYGPEERVANPDPDQQPLTVRPQVYVRYYHNIGVKMFREGGMNGDRDDLVTVEFDPQTVGLEKPIRAHVDANEPVLGLLRDLHSNGQPASVAIETTRKKKSAETKEPIGPLPPIHGLRGASNPDGSGSHQQMMGPSGANTSNKLAMVNGRPTKHLASNASEWRLLTSNKAGDLPPDGWKFYSDKDDWTKIGVIVPDGVAPVTNTPSQPTAGAPLDVQSLVKALGPGLTSVIQQAVADEFAKQAAAEATEDHMKGRPRGRGFSEGKPWDVRTSDGRVNLGTYMATNAGFCMRWALDYLADRDEAVGDTSNARELANTVLSLADRAQADAYGHGAQPDRCATSHKEATRWVQWVISNENPVPADPDWPNDAEAAKAWQDTVVTAAASYMAASGEVVGDYLTNRANMKKNPRAETVEETEPEPSGPPAHVVGALLQTATAKWSDLQVVGNVGKQVRERGFSDLVVSLNTDGDEGTVLNYPAVDGEKSGVLSEVLRNRWTEIKDEQVTKPEDAAPQENPAANSQQAPTPKSDPSTTVTSFINRVQQATSLDQVKGLFQKAHQQNFLATRIGVTKADDGMLVYDTTGTGEGFESWTAAQILEHLRDQFDGQSVPAAPADDAVGANGSPVVTAQQLADKATEAVASQRQGEVTAADARKQLTALMSSANDQNLQDVEISSEGKKGGLRSLLTHLMKTIQD